MSRHQNTDTTLRSDEEILAELRAIDTADDAKQARAWSWTCKLIPFVHREARRQMRGDDAQDAEQDVLIRFMEKARDGRLHAEKAERPATWLRSTIRGMLRD